jgi:hypothetical protein
MELKDLSSINYDDYYLNKLNIYNTDFYDISSKQHYRLLSYLSSLFNFSTIMDIGTHQGYSSLALSFNETNIVYSFDIVDNKTEPNIINRDNIRFIMDNLWDDKIQDNWKSIILSSPFIFLDVDPHNGKMEYEFYQFLLKNNYTGFLVCDDIWEFSDMRNHFWYKINHDYCYDVTHLGHLSGTGIIVFPETPKEILNLFHKQDLSNWTLITSYFDLTKCDDASNEIKSRDSNYYLSNSISTLSLPYNLVIITDEASIEIIKPLRPEYLKHKTEYIICDFNKLTLNIDDDDDNDNNNDKRTFEEYRNDIINNRTKYPYSFDNRNTASYYLFCLSRYIMMKRVIKKNTFNSTHFGWINFCMERMGYKNIMKLEEAMSQNRNKFSTCYIDYIPETLINNTSEYFKWGRCSMCSGFFTGNYYYMNKVCGLIQNQFLEYLKLGYGHADEQLYSPVYFKNPELFEHYYGDYCEMITNYVYVYDNYNSILVNFIKNSYEMNNYKKCIESCNFLLKSIILKKCPSPSSENICSIEWYKTKSLKHIQNI